MNFHRLIAQKNYFLLNSVNLVYDTRDIGMEFYVNAENLFNKAFNVNI